jgi:hypothetical protein
MAKVKGAEAWSILNQHLQELGLARVSCEPRAALAQPSAPTSRTLIFCSTPQTITMFRLWDQAPSRLPFAPSARAEIRHRLDTLHAG